ncbi:unnamed protein product [Knipowitschia caucasica]
MEETNEERLDSPSRNSYIGSYYQPPDKWIPLPRRLDYPFHSVSDSPSCNQHVSQSKQNIDSQAVVDALKKLHEKMGRTEFETSRHTERSRQVSLEAQNQQQANAPSTQNLQRTDSDGSIRCRILQKHLEKTKRSIEKAKKEHNVLLQNQTLLKDLDNADVQSQKEKLEALEFKYEKLSRTQTQAEMKLILLEEKLQKEEHERKLMQERTEELQREFDNSLERSSKETIIKKKSKKAKNKEKMTLKQNEKSTIHSFPQKMPFVAGTSTSPSHSVHANVQSVLHMMKLYQPLLRRKDEDLVTRSSVLHRHQGGSSDEALGSLSDLLLALQDELGKMSFEHLELVHLIDNTQDLQVKQDLKHELERLLTKMEDKSTQITKLRTHQKLIHKLNMSQQHSLTHAEKTTLIHPPTPSPVKPQNRSLKQPASPRNLRLLRETQQFRNSLKQSDVVWET